MRFAVALAIALYLFPWIVQQSAHARPQPESASEMERLIRNLAGEWSTEEIYEASELVAKGGIGHSRDTYRVGPARLSLIEEYHSDGVAGKSWGIGIIWWDRKTSSFGVTWCDSFALDAGCRTSPQAARWRGDAFEISDSHEASGKMVFEREVWSNFTPTSYTQTLYVGDSPNALKRFVTIKATRVAKHN